MSSDMQRQLQAYLTGAAPHWQHVQVTDLASISSGWECDVYAFTVEHGPASSRRREELVLRVYQGGPAYEDSAHEFHGMTRLLEAGYSVPQMRFLERDGSPFGKPFTIMERVYGREMWPLMFPSYKEVTPDMLDLFVRLFVQLHALDWQPFLRHLEGLDASDPLAFVDRELGRWQEYLARFDMPGFRPVVDWLEAHKDQVPCKRPSVIHWDFHPGNILVCEDGTASVIDWTQWDVSDARFDLAWTLLLISTQRDLKWRDVILREYERQAQTRIEGIEYFDVAACAKRLFFVVVALQEGPEALGMRREAASKMKGMTGHMRKVCDLLLERTGLRIPEVEKLMREA